MLVIGIGQQELFGDIHRGVRRSGRARDGALHCTAPPPTLPAGSVRVGVRAQSCRADGGGGGGGCGGYEHWVRWRVGGSGTHGKHGLFGAAPDGRQRRDTSDSDVLQEGRHTDVGDTHERHDL